MIKTHLRIQLMLHFKLLLMWPYQPQTNESHPLTSLGKYGMAGHTWPHLSSSRSLKGYLFLAIISMQKL